MAETSSKDSGETSFDQVLNAEIDFLRNRHQPSKEDPDAVYKQALDDNLTGLAFSGGGIRSATFNLGFIQALAHYRLLSKFDYLSTVSGGGYIGGWLSALLEHERGANALVDEKFQKCLSPHLDGTASVLDKTVGFDPVEHKAVRYIRCYSNFLSPRLGLSGDMLANIAVFLRNFLLMQLILISLVASVVLLAYLVGAGSQYLAHAAPMPAADALWSTITLLFGVAPLLFATTNAAWFLDKTADGNREEPPLVSDSWKILFLVIIPCFIAALLFSIRSFSVAHAQPETRDMLDVAVLGGFVYVISWIIGAASKKCLAIPDEAGAVPLPPSSKLRNVLIGGFAFLVSGAVFGLLLFTQIWYVAKYSIDVWYLVAYGPPFFILTLSFAATLHIGLGGSSLSELDREWLARLGGFVLFYSLAWTLLFSLIIYSAPLVQWIACGGLAALITWFSGSAIGAWFARSKSTSGKLGGVRYKEVIAHVAPWIFLVGLCIIIAYLTHLGLTKAFLPAYDTPSNVSFAVAVKQTLQRLGTLQVAWIFIPAFAMSALFFFLAWFIDINLFSLHTPYANRLTRAYLGARHAGVRKPNPFTGFDKKDDLYFHVLKEQRPIPIINTAINMTGGDDLGWQTRRSASFAFTPCFSGFEMLTTQGEKRGTYRPTNQYAGGLTLGSLIAISGAAANPNMGYHTSASVAAMLTVFNLRLGRWCGNPKRDTWKSDSPTFAAKPILDELTGSATAEANWINLSDGGHFENLGAYELIRRRCKLVVVTDAACDPKYQFEDLANLIRKCWTDFGVNIRFDNFELMRTLKDKDKRLRKYHGVIGRIVYDEMNSEMDGVFVYVKCSMNGDEWPDIRQYADVHKDFPHESTADQFFDENQFEAYRHLGYKIGAEMAWAWGNILWPALTNNDGDTKYRMELQERFTKIEGSELIAQLLAETMPYRLKLKGSKYLFF